MTLFSSICILHPLYPSYIERSLTHTVSTYNQCLSSSASHGYGDFERLLAEQPPGYRIVCNSELFSLPLSFLILFPLFVHPPPPLSFISYSSLQPLFNRHLCFVKSWFVAFHVLFGFTGQTGRGTGILSVDAALLLSY